MSVSNVDSLFYSILFHHITFFTFCRHNRGILTLMNQTNFSSQVYIMIRFCLGSGRVLSASGGVHVGCWLGFWVHFCRGCFYQNNLSTSKQYLSKTYFIRHSVVCNAPLCTSTRRVFFKIFPIRRSSDPN